ncbi:hypothetical protein PFLUV_G00198790 [Perca fluviatilis]|uniref:Uncharacterized protein n=1 Tax=Perca fluviatilis TaxID=8168 RepID=A0A6A5EDY2_PERFL|nr:hypothetical protein PFLUV_G00198790 [Perca fluviatilis]
MPTTPRQIMLGRSLIVSIYYTGVGIRINPDEGTKCMAEVGTSRKAGVVQRKVTSISSQVTTFLQRLTKIEWKTSN